MSSLEIFVLKVQRRLIHPDIDEAKILKYLRELDKISIGISVLKSTGIGKTINNLRQRDETQITDLANNLVQKWKEQARKQTKEEKQVTPVDSAADLITESSEAYPSNRQSNHGTKHKGYESNLNKHTSSTRDCNDTSNMTTEDEMQQRKKFKKLKQREREKKEREIEQQKEKKKERAKAATLQLCDVSFGCEIPTAVSKIKKKAGSSSTSSLLRKSIDRIKPNQVSSQLPPLPPLQTVELSLLPEIQPNYRPNRIPDSTLLDTPGKKHKGVLADVDYSIVSRNSRTQVFSGKRTANTCGIVSSLYDLSMKVLIENIDALQDTGGVPYDILKPVLDRCSPQQLFQLEEYNPYFIDDSDPLWEKHCKREFKGSEVEEEQTWRELYMEKLDEREQRLKKINEKISAAQAAKKPERQVKLAYVMTEAKPPPQVRRKQAKYGTGKGVTVVEPSPRVTSRDRPSTSSSHHRASNVQSPKKHSGAAPMMKKTMKMLKMQRNVKTTQVRRY